MTLRRAVYAAFHDAKETLLYQQRGSAILKRLRRLTVEHTETIVALRQLRVQDDARRGQ